MLPKLPKRLPYELTIAAAVLLGSCSGSGPRLYTHDEIADIADDACDDAVTDNAKVRDLESRVAALEERLGS